jgi:hypothetical protein
MKTESPIRTGGWRARLRPSPAMLVAVVALFVALGGVGYAATTIGSEEIRNNSVQSVDVKNDDLLSRDIKDDSVLSRDITDGTVLSRDITDGTVLSRDITDGTVLSRDITDGTVLERDIDPEALAAFKGPRAFAHVTDDNTSPGGVHVDAANAKGVVEANVSNPDNGLYCFEDLAFNPKIAIVTLDTVQDTIPSEEWLDPDSASARAAPSGACLGDQASVTLTNALNQANVTIDGNFYVAFE